MRKLTFLMSLFLFVLAVDVFAALTNTVILNSPVSGSYDHDGNVTFDLNIQPAEGRFVTNVTIWTNITGTWQPNMTLSNTSWTPAVNNASSKNINFRRWGNWTDATSILWGVEVGTNASAGTDYGRNWSGNFSLFVEFPPTVTVDVPVAQANFSDSFFVNVSVSSVYIPPSEVTGGFTCELFTNATGSPNVTLSVGRSLFTNGTNETFLVNLPEGKSQRLRATCRETARPVVVASSFSNVTVGVDKTGPFVLFRSNATNGFVNSNSIQVNFTVTDLMPERLIVFVNTSGNAWGRNFTGYPLANGSVVTFDLQNLSDGDYAIGGYLWDIVALDDEYWVKIPNVTSNLTHNATLNNHTFTVDTIAPSISANTNLSKSVLLVVAINWTTSEPSNGSITYGNVSKQHTTWLTETASYRLGHTVNVTVEEGKTYYYNITSCDRAGNCNASVKEFTIAPQTGIYAGWNAFTIFDSTISMGKVYNDSGADYVYWWNATSQAWVSHTGGVGSQASTVLYGGSVAWLFKSTNGTWTRDVSVRDAYRLNLTSGVNFVGAQFDYDFTNLSVSFFNRTAYKPDATVLGENNTVGGTADGLGAQKVNIATAEFFSSYNNSDQRYVSFFRNETFNNRTVIPRGWAVFVGANSNVTWNGTSVVTNWTISG